MEELGVRRVWKISSTFLFYTVIFLAMEESISKEVEALRILKKKKDGQTYENLVGLCSKMYGWDAVAAN